MQIEQDEELYRMSLQMRRVCDKIKSSEARMDQLEVERIEMMLWAQELYLTENVVYNRPPDFRRQQSALYNKLHPDTVHSVLLVNRFTLEMGS